jgi:cob(I)alamin adenosyltransferase
MQNEKRQARHKKAMQTKKELVDEKIANAQQDKGLLLVLTGNGKGKTSSAFGTAVRSLGYGYKVAIVQFIKGSGECGERNFLEGQSLVSYQCMATDFTWETQDRESDTLAAQATWSEAEKYLRDESIHLVVLDELTYMTKYGYLDSVEVLDCLKNRPTSQHVIVTGRAASQALIEIADTVSEIKPIKHAFDSGIKAQRGIEW